MKVSRVFLDQALKPKGDTIEEKLTFLSNWYLKASKTEPSDEHQARFCSLMGEWSVVINDIKNEQDIHASIKNLLVELEKQYDSTNSTAEKSLYSYLFVELQRIIEVKTI
jgi:hypothetical protein